MGRAQAPRLSSSGGPLGSQGALGRAQAGVLSSSCGPRVAQGGPGRAQAVVLSSSKASFLRAKGGGQRREETRALGAESRIGAALSVLLGGSILLGCCPRRVCFRGSILIRCCPLVFGFSGSGFFPIKKRAHPTRFKIDNRLINFHKTQLQMRHNFKILVSLSLISIPVGPWVGNI